MPISGDGTGEELTRFSREDGQKSVRRDTPDLTAEALDSIESVQSLREFTSGATGESSELPAPYFEGLTNDLKNHPRISRRCKSHLRSIFP